MKINYSKKALSLLASVGMLAFSFVALTSRVGATHSSTGISIQLSDSAPNSSSNYTFDFTLTGGVAETQQIILDMGGVDIQNFSSITSSDVDFKIDGTDVDIAADCTGSEMYSYGYIGLAGFPAPLRGTLEVCDGDGGAISAGAEIEIEIGTHATHQATGVNQLINPTSTGSTDVSIIVLEPIGIQILEMAITPIAIVDAVTVSAEIGAQFTFTVAGVNSGLTAANGDTDCDGGSTTAVTTTATTIPFGSLTADVDKCASHDLTVSTNASGGYTVSAYLASDLTSAAGDTLAVFEDGTAPTPKAWVSPGTNHVVGTPDTYSAFGVTSEDLSLSGGDTYGTALYTGLSKVSTSPTELMYHNGPADGTTADIGATTVGYKIEAGNLAKAGNYSASLTYLATPTF